MASETLDVAGQALQIGAKPGQVLGNLVHVLAEPLAGGHFGFIGTHGSLSFILAKLTVNPVPYHAKCNTHEISDAGRDQNQYRCPAEGKGLDDVHRLYEVNPKQKVDQRLGDAKRHQKRPKQMPAAQQGTKHETGSIWTNLVHKTPPGLTIELHCAIDRHLGRRL
jgi:hypothetical protein